MIKAIIACTSHGVMGNRGTLPWPKMPQDLAWFKQHTLGQVVVMGRRTWDDPKMPKPLPDRINCVFSKKPLREISAQRLEGPVADVLAMLSKKYPNKDIFVIGGADLIEQAWPIIDEVYLTRIKLNYSGDTKVNVGRHLQDFRLVSVKPGENCTYEIWSRLDKQ